MKNNSEKLHQWNVLPKEAVSIQEELRHRVEFAPLPKNIKLVAGVDVSMNLYSKDAYAGIIVLSYPSLIPLVYSLAKSTISFPYIPGLLSFREIPALIECFKGLSLHPDILLVDGQGIAHPRHFGIASHLGVLLNIPTIGCAKSKLYGNFREPKNVGDSSFIIDPKTKEPIGAALKTKDKSKPLIISPGHLVTIDSATSFVKTCLTKYRLPEPTRLAHELVNRFRKGEVK